MKVLVLVEWYYPIGGIEVFVSQVLERLPEDITVTVAILPFGKAVIPRWKNPSIHPVLLPKKGYFKVLKELMERERFDIIHSQHVSPIGVAGIVLAKKYRLPILISNHRVPTYTTGTWKDFFIIPLATAAYWLLNNRATHLTVPTKTVRKIFRSIHIYRPIDVLSCGVDIFRFVPKPAEHALPTILFVGRFAVDKNLEILINAFAQVLKKEKARLVLVGFQAMLGNAWDALQNQIQRLGIAEHIEFPGHIPSQSHELIEQYQNADIFAISSLYETQSIVTLEALACGLPVVASRSGALPELIHHGKNGFLFEAGNATDMAQHLITLVRSASLRKTMGTASRETALAHDIEKSTVQLTDLYRTLVTHQAIPHSQGE